MRRIRHAAGTVQVVPHDRRFRRRDLRRGGRGRGEDRLFEFLEHRTLGLVALPWTAGETTHRVAAAL